MYFDDKDAMDDALASPQGKAVARDIMGFAADLVTVFHVTSPTDRSSPQWNIPPRSWASAPSPAAWRGSGQLRKHPGNRPDMGGFGRADRGATCPP